MLLTCSPYNRTLSFYYKRDGLVTGGYCTTTGTTYCWWTAVLAVDYPLLVLIVLAVYDYHPHVWIVRTRGLSSPPQIWIVFVVGLSHPTGMDRSGCPANTPPQE
jgi:hypothetical protein